MDERKIRPTFHIRTLSKTCIATVLNYFFRPSKKVLGFKNVFRLRTCLPLIVCFHNPLKCAAGPLNKIIYSQRWSYKLSNNSCPPQMQMNSNVKYFIYF